MFAEGLLLSGQSWFGYRSRFWTLYPSGQLPVWFTVSSRRQGVVFFHALLGSGWVPWPLIPVQVPSVGYRRGFQKFFSRRTAFFFELRSGTFHSVGPCLMRYPAVGWHYVHLSCFLVTSMQYRSRCRTMLLPINVSDMRSILVIPDRLASLG